MEIIYLRMRQTESTEYKYFEIKGYKGSVIIELYMTTNQQILIENADVGDGKGMTRYGNAKFGVTNFKFFLKKITGETFQGTRTAFFKDLYQPTLDKKEYKPTSKPIRFEIPKKVIPPVSSKTKPTNVVQKAVVVIDEDGELEVNIPDGPTDVYTVSKRRKEQAALRLLLMKDAPHHHCAICGDLLPNDLLVTSHIKKRTYATEEERRNSSIVVPMCKLGCDSLFENGWVGVVGRRVTRIRTENSTPHLDMKIQKLLGRECMNVNEISSKFYDWHREFHVKRMIPQKSQC
ncbi:hypothetical protein BK121_03325 [Paenibacillus odorifer]|uniref:hypothetical protein n=1 Tax=Paenibacillus odorifer TaxID=189426 RepID=UPI00096F5606|nr:hypothetical protein [Paenibacillus odorifer]OMC75058.1 hypothetical protein BK121_03325 [Paenibacillus odorifer]